MERFLKKLCTEKSLDETQVIADWTTFNDDYTKYNKMKKPELLEICKTHGYDTRGSKTDLVDSIMTKKAPAEPTPKPPPKGKVKSLEKDILTKMKANIPPVLIKRNDHGNFEHKDSGFVFDRKNSEVIGKQLEDGTVAQLTKDDIDTCNKYGFKYVIPFNLSSGANAGEDNDKNLDDELNEEDFIEEEDEESEEEIEYDE